MIEWTKEQKTAIGSRGKTLLVSAAAGSGKTAVLTARIIAQLTDRENPVDISRMLAVTFTKAAATELRNRILIAINKQLACDPSNRVLSRQIVKLGSAKISTIHSFCYDIIKANFEQLGIGANVRVADETEMKIINNDVMERIINELYDNPPDSSKIGDFAEFADNFITDRDEHLNDILNGIYMKVREYTDGIEFIKTSSENLLRSSTEDFMKSSYGSIISLHINKQLDYFMTVYDDAVRYFSEMQFFEKSYMPAFLYDYDFMNNMKKLLGFGQYNRLKSFLITYDRPRLGNVKADMQTEESILYKKIRDEFNDQRKKITDCYFSSDEIQIKENMEKTAKICSDIYKFLKLFEIKLNEEKRFRSIVDFNDLEQMTYKMLYCNGNKTSFALEQASRFDEIFIDEYQDINEIQDKIFTAVSRDNNKFMVGDIKQSIYGFRGASPEIFSNYRKRFPKYSENTLDANTIYLSHNFRCDKNIIDFNNIIFKCLFNNNSGSVPYEEEENLMYAKSEDGHTPSKVEVAVIKKASVTKNEEESGSSNEAKYVVNKIRSLIKEGYRLKDMTILLRSAKNDALQFESELSKMNISYYNNVTRDFFENAEVLLMLCILNCIDNPTRDIYLAGALKSPLYGITLDELIQIRKQSGNNTLYYALQEYTEKNNFAKGKYFLEKLLLYRTYAEGQPVDRLIWYIYRDTAILSLIYDKDKSGRNVRRSNLMLLYDYARRFESSSFRGLYNFIRYLNDIISERETLETAKISTETDDAVKIMTVHQSKGLEFPVCFLCGTDKQFNKNDITSDLLIDRSAGMAVKLRDSSGFARFETPIRRAVALKITGNNIDEEMRVLYVALTRAKERLIITASSSDPEKMISECAAAARYISPYSISDSPTYIKWILTALKSVSYHDCCQIQICDGIDARDESESDNTINIQPPVIYDKSVDEITRIIKERFEYRYPYQYMTKIPAKISVSELFPSLLDAESSAFNILGNKITLREKPDFLNDQPDKATSAERGTATHVFMQFCDFQKVERIGVKSETERLVAEGFINKSSAQLINICQIEIFFKSRIYREMKTAKRLWREIRFNVRLPAADFTSDDSLKNRLLSEYIFVQGVIDCLFFDKKGSLVLVDYKTDFITNDLKKKAEEAKRMLKERHGQQLAYYKAACRQIIKKIPDEVFIYSFGLGDEINLG